MENIIKSFIPFLLFVLICSSLNAQTKLSVQGVIRLSDGNAIEDGYYPIEFKLYDTITGGNLLWSEVQPQLKVTSGIYSTILGEVTPLDLEFNAFYYLSLTVEGEELLPRAPLTSAPYSNSVLGFDNVFPSTGNVGIGTTTPTNKLDVLGDTHLDGIFAVQDSGIYVTPGGLVGIGTTTPTAQMEVKNSFKLTSIGDNATAQMTVTGGPYLPGGGPSGFVQFGIVGATGTAYIWQFGDKDLQFGTNDELRMSIKNNGAVGIGTNAPTHLLHITDVGRSTSANWATSSDVRVKKNITTLQNGALANILQLRPVNYEWKDAYRKSNGGLKIHNTGFIAQEVEAIFPEMVSQEKEEFGASVIEDFRVLNISDLPVHLVKAMQEQQAQIENLKKENELLKNALTAQSEASNTRLNRLEAKLNEIIGTQSVSKL